MLNGFLSVTLSWMLGVDLFWLTSIDWRKSGVIMYVIFYTNFLIAGLIDHY